MTWDQDGLRIDDPDEASDRTIELDIEGMQSALDRVNLVWLIDAYRAETQHVLLRILTAGPVRCNLSADRIANDCQVSPRTVRRHRAVLIDDGVLIDETKPGGLPSFKIVWGKIIELAWHGLLRRPAQERAKIINGLFRDVIVRYGLEYDESLIAKYGNPSTPSFQPKRKYPSGAAKRRRKRLTGGPLTENMGPLSAQPGPPVSSAGAPLSPVSGGPCHPCQGHPNLNQPEAQNQNKRNPNHNASTRTVEGPPDSPPHRSHYNGQPIFRDRVLDLMRATAAPTTRKKIVATFGVGGGAAQRALAQLVERGDAKKIGLGQYRPTGKAE